MPLILIGLNHHSAPLEVRERVAYSRDEALEVLGELKSRLNVPQALLLSTCNRTELYAMVGDAEGSVPPVASRLFEGRLQNGESVDDFLYRQVDEEAIRHFFRVACGLDSMMLGEQEILHQVKDAYDASIQAQTAGTILHKLASRAFHVGKKARSETKIGYGAVSVAFAAVELAEKVFQSLEGRGALLVGAGENGELCARHLLSRKVEPFYIANRTLARAEDLANNLGGEALSLDHLEDVLSRVDIVVSTTGAPHAVIDGDMVKQAMKRRGGRSMILTDIAVPRDVEPGVADIPNVFLFDIEALKGIVDDNLNMRKGEIPEVERMIQAEVEHFVQWKRSLAAGPTIGAMHKAFEAMRKHEFDRNAKRFSDEDREQLDVFSRTLVRKLLMGVTQEIKKYRPDNPVEMERLAMLRQMFGLDAPEGDDDGKKKE
jgi:glutamyl-tRNA reductase